MRETERMRYRGSKKVKTNNCEIEFENTLKKENDFNKS